MSKRLIMILALALVVVGVAFTAYAEVQNVKVGGDLTTLGITRNNFNLAKTTALHNLKASGLAMIARLKIDADLTDAVAVSMVLRNERIWGTTSRVVTGTESETTGNDSDIDLAAAYVTLKEFLNDKVTLKVGQMPVKLGSGFIVGDSDTNRVSTGALNPGFGDLSSRKAFTGGLAVLDYSPLKVTLAGLKITESTLESKADDVNAFIVSAAYDTGVKNTVVSLDYVLRDARNKGNDVHNIGTRVVSAPIENLFVTGEVIYQAQKNVKLNNKEHSSDTGVLLTANYALPKMMWKPSLGLIYLRVGDNWNSMFEDLTAGDIINAILPLTDCEVISGSVSAKPMEDVTAKLTYVNASLITAVGDAALPVWRGDTATTTYYNMTDKKDLGNEVDLSLMYDYTEDVQFGLSAGYFKPGDAFDKDANRKSASQVIGSMKVTF